MLLVNLSLMPWVDQRLKRNQAMFVNLLCERGLFDQGIWIDPPAIAPPGLPKYTAGASVSSVRNRSVGFEIEVAQPVYNILHWHLPLMRRTWAKTVAQKILHDVIGGRPFCLWLNCPGTLSNALSRELAPYAALRVFDSSDDFKAFPELINHVDELASLADHLICVNATTCERIQHPRKLVFTNCTSWESFQKRRDSFALRPFFPKRSGETYIGFIGGIHESRTDEPLLRRLFTEFPSYKFLFIGYTDRPEFVARLTAFPNVHFLPAVPYKVLPEVIRAFDVAIVPHLDNECTRGNDLLKVLDYFACKVPVVSTRSSNVDRFGDALFIADTHDEFVDYIRNLTQGKIHHNPANGAAIAREQSWEEQVPKLASKVRTWLEDRRTCVSSVGAA